MTDTREGTVSTVVGGGISRGEVVRVEVEGWRAAHYCWEGSERKSWEWWARANVGRRKSLDGVRGLKGVTYGGHGAAQAGRGEGGGGRRQVVGIFRV